MRVAIVLALLGACLCHDPLWEEWKGTHSKSYTEEEEIFRYATFLENAKLVSKHNLEYDMGLHTYTLGLNQLADLSNEEYRQTILMPSKQPETEGVELHEMDATNVASSVDWRSKGCVTPVKDQGQCGSCWSFSATGALECQYFLKQGTLKSFSEQELVDCDNLCYGCSGGWPYKGFQYWETTGFELEASYRYTARDGYCQATYYTQYGKVSSYRQLSQSESTLQAATSSVGTISVAIDASHYSFQLYHSGVYYEPNCSSSNLDHAVLVVGYGSSSGGDYWIVKNSWAKIWGDQGYIHMARNRGNNCGIASSAAYPIL